MPLPRLFPPRLLPYQESAASWLAGRRRGLVQAPAGSGKTIMAAAALARCVFGRERPGKVRMGWIANTNEQCEQARAALAKFPGLPDAIEATICCPAGAPERWEVDVLIVDECFPAGTMIDGRRIEEIQVGDSVRAFDHSSNTPTISRVARLFKSRPSGMARVHLRDGRSVVCTPGHPFWIGSKYLAAIHLTADNSVLIIPNDEDLLSMRRIGGAFRAHPERLLREVPRISPHGANESRIGALPGVRGAGDLQPRVSLFFSAVGRCAQWVGVLLRGLPRSLSSTDCLGDDGANQSRSRERSNEDEESDEQLGYSFPSISHAPSHEVEATAAGRQWARPDGSRVDSSGGAELARECDRQDGKETDRRLSPSLQGGRGKSILENRDRTRWTEPSCGGKEGTGSQEGGVALFIGVDRVEILEPTSDGTFSGVCADGFVYNIEVERFHNYFAGGVLVHNCHHAPAATWSALVAAHGGCLWMFSATPFGDDAERNAKLRALCEQQIHVVPREAVAARVVPAHVYLLNDTDGGLKDPINAEIKEEIAKRRKFSKLSEDELYRQTASNIAITRGVCENRARNAAIVRLARQHAADSTLILVPKIEHGEALMAQIPGSALCFSKMGKKKRRETIEAARAGELRCMIATSLADEGLDVPIFNVLIMAGAGRSAARIEQRTGRVLRAHGDKTHGVIYDFADQQHPLLENQSRARVKVYRRLGYTVHAERPVMAHREELAFV